MAQKTTALDFTLESLINHLVESKKTASENRGTNGAIPHLRPPLQPQPRTEDAWDGSLLDEKDMTAISEVFDLYEARESLKEAFDPKSPGTSSDSVLLPEQIYFAQQAERAYRARTSNTFVRSLAHLAGREVSQGGEKGTLKQSLNYFSSIIRQGAEKEEA